MVGGVDEAGRGCVLGPLAVAGVCVESGRLRELAEIGVRDSKLLTPARRESLYPEICRVCDRVDVSRIQPAEIDTYVRRGKKRRRLNYLETIHMARVIDRLSVHEVFIDAPDANPDRFSTELLELMVSRPRVVAEHKADARYSVVSAASIVAKVERDRAVEELRRLHGDFGSGYPSDPDTISFLRAWVARESSRPEFSRKSWRTWERIGAFPTLD